MGSYCSDIYVTYRGASLLSQRYQNHPKTTDSTNIMIAGDFNSIINPKLDRSHSSTLFSSLDDPSSADPVATSCSSGNTRNCQQTKKSSND